VSRSAATEAIRAIPVIVGIPAESSRGVSRFGVRKRPAAQESVDKVP